MSVKQLFGGSLTLSDYDGQVAEALAMVRALNKMTKAGYARERAYCLKTQPVTGILTRNLIYSTKLLQLYRPGIGERLQAPDNRFCVMVS